jgi:hypothetical protein
MWSTGGSYELGGAVGQHDASAVVMTGGPYELEGGFWCGVGSACACPADLNGDGGRNGADVQGFVDCLVSTGTNCLCADIDGNGFLEFADVVLFVGELLAGTPCPG